MKPKSVKHRQKEKGKSHDKVSYACVRKRGRERNGCRMRADKINDINFDKRLLNLAVFFSTTAFFKF